MLDTKFVRLPVEQDTPHKGDPENFCLFLELLDKDVYGDVKSLEEAMRRQQAPFYLRRVKEALVSFPDPDTGKVKTLFTKRNVRTTEFSMTDAELDFYDALTRYVEDQSIKAAADESARGRALGFTMAMLQRRFASSIYAVRRSLERMKEKREKILADPEAYREEQKLKNVPEDFDDLPEDEQQKILDQLESVVASVDPAALRDEIMQLAKLIEHARLLEQQEHVQPKLARLKDALTQQGVFKDRDMKLLIFTEHKDTLDYLAGDGKSGRPVGKLREWGLSVTVIHGGMKIGDRDTAGTRIYAEREFREDCQVMVATEAAGEGINLQFCWLMVNYDIPWNPVRLEQRMGRIHRYGQEKDCLILNFVSPATREGRVLQKLFERIKSIEEDLDPLRTGKVFNVLGEVFPANQLERMVREMYARNLTEDVIKSRIVAEVDKDRFRRITHSTLEGLAKRELNLAALVGKSAEARERRLVPEVIEDFFCQAGPLASVHPKEVRANSHVYRLGRIPRTLWPIAERLEPRFGKLGREYKQVVFDKTLLTKDSTSEWLTPGHPLFAAVREDVLERVREDLLRGSVFYELNCQSPYLLDVFSAAVKDGRSNPLHLPNHPRLCLTIGSVILNFSRSATYASISNLRPRRPPRLPAPAPPRTRPRSARPPASHRRLQRRRLRVGRVRARDGASPDRGGRRDPEQAGGGADLERLRRRAGVLARMSSCGRGAVADFVEPRIASRRPRRPASATAPARDRPGRRPCIRASRAATAAGGRVGGSE